MGKKINDSNTHLRSNFYERFPFFPRSDEAKTYTIMYMKMMNVLITANSHKSLNYYIDRIRDGRIKNKETEELELRKQNNK
jgi:hypothetical protein